MPVKPVTEKGPPLSMQHLPRFAGQKQAGTQGISSIFSMHFLNNEWPKAIRDIICHTINSEKEFKGSTLGFCRTMSSSESEMGPSLDLPGCEFMKPVLRVSSARRGNPVNEFQSFKDILSN